MGILGERPPSRDAWAKTHWSVVANLGTRDDPTWEASWQYLFDTYRRPMERYVQRVLTRTRGRPATAEEAGEIVQDFLAQCVEKGWLSNADPRRGKFRAYIQTLLKRYTYRTLRHARAQRRNPGPDKRVYSLLESDAQETLTAEEQVELDEFTEGWVRVAVDRTLDRLAAEHERYRMVILDLIQTEGEGSPDLAERVGCSRSQLPVLKHRARARFCKLFESELAKTVGDQESFEDEWRALRGFVR